MSAEFVKGDRVERSGNPNARRKSSLGTYVRLSRDGTCDIVQWDGTSKNQSIVRGHIRKVDTAVASLTANGDFR